jgi:hypothetical protein
VVTSGVVELAAGALSGWVYALAIMDKDRARKLGIVSTPRIRQWHLDLIALGTATTVVGLAVPEAPSVVQRSLVAGAWANAMLFLPVAFKPGLADDSTYRGVVSVSFVATSVGFGGMARTALGRRRALGDK